MVSMPAIYQAPAFDGGRLLTKGFGPLFYLEHLGILRFGGLKMQVICNWRVQKGYDFPEWPHCQAQAHAYVRSREISAFRLKSFFK